MPNESSTTLGFLMVVSLAYGGIAFVRAHHARVHRRTQISVMRRDLERTDTPLSLSSFATAWRAYADRCPPGLDRAWLARELGVAREPIRLRFTEALDVWRARVREVPARYMNHESDTVFDEETDGAHVVFRVANALLANDGAWQHTLQTWIREETEPVALRALLRQLDGVSEGVVEHVVERAEHDVKRGATRVSVWCAEAAVLVSDARQPMFAQRLHAALKQVQVPDEALYARELEDACALLSQQGSG